MPHLGTDHCPVGNWPLHVLTCPFQLSAWQTSFFRAQLQRLPQKLAALLQPTIEEAPPSLPNAGPISLSAEQAPEPGRAASCLQRLQCLPWVGCPVPGRDPWQANLAEKSRRGIGGDYLPCASLSGLQAGHWEGWGRVWFRAPFRESRRPEMEVLGTALGNL